MRLIEKQHQHLAGFVFTNYFKNLSHIPHKFTFALWPLNAFLVISSTLAVLITKDITKGNLSSLGLYGPLRQLCQQQHLPDWSMHAETSGENKSDPRALFTSTAYKTMAVQNCEGRTADYWNAYFSS